ncbi:MAG: hypothetical protein NVSMB64_24060 [Candidatus Velthaea sp.]
MRSARISFLRSNVLFLAIFAIVLWGGGRAALGAPAAGVIPSNIAIDVTGEPAADGNFLDSQIRDALDRRIRPTLFPGAGISYGPIVPWPLLPLASGSRAAVNVTVSIAGDGASSPVTGVTTVTIDNIPVRSVAPAVLFLSDDPEYLQSEGVVLRGNITAERAARLYYYHSDIGLPRDLDVVVTASVPTRLQLVKSGAGPELDVMNVGHAVSRDFLRYELQNEGAVIDVVPGTPFIVRHVLLLQGEVVAGAVDFNVIGGGPAAVSVVSSAAGGRPEAYLDGPRVPFDGHSRHGAFDLTGFGTISASYIVGGPDAAITYGGRAPTPRNLDATDIGRDYGDYGVVHRFTFTLENPTDAPHVVYLYQRPLGGPVRSSFLVDGLLKELGCVRLHQPYWLTSYQLPPHSSGASTTVTMTDGGSFYPLEVGATETLPQVYTPPIGTPDGCSAI